MSGKEKEPEDDDGDDDEEGFDDSDDAAPAGGGGGDDAGLGDDDDPEAAAFGGNSSGGGAGADDDDIDDEPDPPAAAPHDDDSEMGGGSSDFKHSTRPSSRAGATPSAMSVDQKDSKSASPFAGAATTPTAAASNSTLSPSLFSALSNPLMTQLLASVTSSGGGGSGGSGSGGASAIPNNWPSELAINAAHPHLTKVHSDKLTVRYMGKGNHSIDAGTVRANSPVPKHVAIYYFEIQLLEAGRGTTAIGFSPEVFPLNSYVGHTNDSFSYGAEGKKYNGLARGDPYAVPFVSPAQAGGAAAPSTGIGARAASAPVAAAAPTNSPARSGAAARPSASGSGGGSGSGSGSGGAAAGGGGAATTASGGTKSESEAPVIGAGINWYTREMFFTRNGQPLGTAFTGIPTVKLYPTISMHSSNEAVRLNFGQRKFRYDIDSYRADEKARYETMIRNGGPSPYALNGNVTSAAAATATAAATANTANNSNRFDKRVLTPLIRSYLMHYAYEDTLKAFDAYTPKSTASTASNGHVHHQHDINSTSGAAMDDSDHAMSDSKRSHSTSQTKARSAASANATNGNTNTHTRSSSSSNGSTNSAAKSHSNGSSTANGAAAVTASTDPAFASISIRKRIRECICTGDIKLAIQLIDALLPPVSVTIAGTGTGTGTGSGGATGDSGSGGTASASVVVVSGMKRLECTRRGVAFQIQCLRFLQIIQQKQTATDEAIKFARDVLAGYNEPVYQSSLHSVMSALAYVDIEHSPIADLLKPKHRQTVADAVNSALLETLTVVATATVNTAGPLLTSSLERLLKHLLCTHALIDHEANGMSPPFAL